MKSIADNWMLSGSSWICLCHILGYAFPSSVLLLLPMTRTYGSLLKPFRLLGPEVLGILCPWGQLLTSGCRSVKGSAHLTQAGLQLWGTAQLPQSPFGIRLK